MFNCLSGSLFCIISSESWLVHAVGKLHHHMHLLFQMFRHPRLIWKLFYDFYGEVNYVSVVFLYAISVMYPTCDDQSVLLLRYQSEKTAISETLMSSFLYFIPSVGCFSKCFMGDFIIFRPPFWYVSLVTCNIMSVPARISHLVCNTH